jgi:hypothetical protein
LPDVLLSCGAQSCVWLPVSGFVGWVQGLLEIKDSHPVPRALWSPQGRCMSLISSNPWKALRSRICLDQHHLQLPPVSLFYRWENSHFCQVALWRLVAAPSLPSLAPTEPPPEEASLLPPRPPPLRPPPSPAPELGREAVRVAARLTAAPLNKLSLQPL